MHWLSNKLSGAPRLRVPCSPYTRTEGTGWHKHICDTCGNAWMHEDATMAHVSAHAHAVGHTCAVCNDEQYYKG